MKENPHASNTLKTTPKQMKQRFVLFAPSLPTFHPLKQFLITKYQTDKCLINIGTLQKLPPLALN